MPHASCGIVNFLKAFAKEDYIQEIMCRCPECAESRCIVKNGSYRRFDPEGDGQIRIQRYLCFRDSCPRVSFSVLPPPLLPRVRLSLCFLLILFARHMQGARIGTLAREYARNWAVIRRALRTATRLWDWIRHEAFFASWGPCPCQNQARWNDFIKQVSYVLYPAT